MRSPCYFIVHWLLIAKITYRVQKASVFGILLHRTLTYIGHNTP